MAISLTQSAATRVRSFLEKRGRGVGLRIGVRKSGCSGYAYTIDYADAIDADDVVFDRDGVKVIVDPESFGLIDGTEVDFLALDGRGTTTNCCFGGVDGRTLFATDGVPGRVVAWEGLPSPGVPVRAWAGP